MVRKPVCGKCNSENVYGMSRVVGYYSIIENWNESKLAELKDRQKGMYKIEEETHLDTGAKIQGEALAVVR